MKNVALLKSQWHLLCQELQADFQLSEKIFIDLVNTYSNSARHYHNLNHIQDILYLIEEVQYQSDRFAVIQLSAWFHDYIYDSQAQDNELRSAVYAEKILNMLNISSEIIQQVKQIILSTKKHHPLIDSIDNLIFLDADLSILGASPDKYLKYAQAIRQEYSHLSNSNYQQGRKKVLINFLARDRIYYMDYFYRKLESSARDNLQAEINFLINN